ALTVLAGAVFLGALAARAADKPAAAPAAAPAKAPAPAAAPAAAAAKGAPADKAPAPAPADKAAAPAAAAAPPAMPTPAPELDQMFKPYEGSWKCDTTFAAGAMGPGTPEVKVKSEVKIKKELGGFWYAGNYKVKKTKAMPGMEGVFMLGYDVAAKAPVNVTYDSTGSYAVETGAGSTAEKQVFVGDGHMMGMKVKMRETMAKKGDKEVEHTFEVDMGKGFTKMGTDVCKK